MKNLKNKILNKVEKINFESITDITQRLNIEAVKNMKPLIEAPADYWLGLYFYSKKDWSTASTYFIKAIKTMPDHAHSNFKLGMCHFKENDWLDAEFYIAKALKNSPETEKWLLQLKQSQRMIKKEEKGNNLRLLPSIQEEILLEKIESDSSNPNNYFKLAELYKSKNKIWLAINAYEQALAINNKVAKWHFSYGEALEKIFRYADAVMAYQNAISCKVINVPIDWYYRMGYAAERSEKSNDKLIAKVAYEEVIKRDKKLNSSVLGIGVFHYAKGYWSDAATALEMTAGKKKYDENNADIMAKLHYKIGFANDRLYNWDAAEKNYILALSYKVKPEWAFRLGFVQEKQKKFIEASQNYRQAAETRSQYTPYWFYRLAFTLEKQGLYEAAAHEYLNLHQHEKAKIIQYRQTVSGKGQEGLGKLLIPLYEIVRVDATREDVWYQIAILHEALQDWKNAEYCFHMAIEKSSECPSLWRYKHGNSLMMLDRFEEACEAFRSYRYLQRAHGLSENIIFKDEGFSLASRFEEYYHVLPIKQDTVLYESYAGQGMSCNPYAIFLKLFNDEKYKGWTHVWVINDPKNIPTEFKKYENVIFIPRDSDGYLRHLATAKILINNSNFPYYYVRRDEQKYISTWHGTPFKTLGTDMKGRLLEHKNFTRNILQSTHLISPNKHTSEVFLNSHGIKGIYNGKLLEVGYPRIDLTIGLDEIEKLKIKEQLGITSEQKVILYAPTWRGVHGDVHFDFEKLQEDMEKLSQIDGSVVLFRGHALIEQYFQETDFGVQSVPNTIDTNRLLSIVDILITDYSSIMFDFLPALKPLILYIYDYDEYKEERGLYFDVKDVPGQVCYEIESVVETIQTVIQEDDFEVSAEENKIKTFCPYDDGSVSDRIINAVFQEQYEDVKIVNEGSHKKSLLIYGGPFMQNGITTSLLNLLHSIDKEKYAVTLVVNPGSVASEHIRIANFEKIPSEVNIVGRVGRMNLSLEDRFIHSINNRDYTLYSTEAQQVLQNSWKHEFKRVFGDGRFDSLIHFEGYDRFWAGVFSSQSDRCRTSIFMHNSMYDEYTLKFPYLKSMFRYYKSVDKCISVSKQTMQLNIENISSQFDISLDKFDYCDNLQNPESLLLQAEEVLSIEDKELFDTFDNDKLFITVGRLSIEKDHKKLINSFLKFLLFYPASRLVIIGDGPLKHELAKQISDLNLEDRVLLLGIRTNPFALIKRADCFILSSNHEGQPMTLLEAMILEKPIIATDITGSRSVLEDRPGHLVENTEEGLLQGMIDFVEGKLVFGSFDYESYQSNAIQMFYSNVC